MIKSQIIIHTAPRSYTYVRDALSDTNGEPEKYYGYTGNARRKINLIPGIPNTGLKEDTIYTFRVNVNGSGLKTYKVSFVRKEGYGNRIEFIHVVHVINTRTKDFQLVYYDGNGNNPGFYFIANGKIPGTTIEVLDGEGENPLFASMDNFESISDMIPSDNLLDQTTIAGKVMADFNALVTNVGVAGEFLSFPESTPTTTLVRGGTSPTTNSAFTIRKSAITGITISESSSF